MACTPAWAAKSTLSSPPSQAVALPIVTLAVVVALLVWVVRRLRRRGFGRGAGQGETVPVEPKR